MKLSVEIEGKEYLLELSVQNGRAEYKLSGEVDNEGSLSVMEVAPGVFSILDARRSLTVRVSGDSGEAEAWIGEKRLRVRFWDPRDRASGGRNASAAGPQEVRALMPGKVVKLLAREGEQVAAGAGLIVVEAMKMQNEMKSPKDGHVARLHVAEGATVGQGEILLVIE